MLELKNDRLTFSFPEVHRDAVCHIEFQRTLRIPDDNRVYPLPPGLGRFPLLHVDDFSDNLPGSWLSHGGAFLPMYQAEALWINFRSRYPFAVKVATGKINALTGEAWSNQLQRSPQDYLVIPDQPWLDGFSVEKGIIRQFVAMPLGAGYTAEEQLSGLAEHGGLQILVYPMKAERYERWKLQHGPRDIVCNIAEPAHEMGLAPGGMMRQDIFEDPYGADAWETTAYSRCFVHLINAVQYAYVTGKQPPTIPPTARKYTEAGLPWFSYYVDDLVALEAAKKLAAMDSVAGAAAKKGVHALPENEPVEVDRVIQVGKRIPEIRDGKW